MTPYTPKTDKLQRSPRWNNGSVLADLAHAEACLREREEEIERLKAGGFGTNDSAITMLTVTVKVSVPGLVLGEQTAIRIANALKTTVEKLFVAS